MVKNKLKFLDFIPKLVDFNRKLTLLFNRIPISKSDFELDGFGGLNSYSLKSQSSMIRFVGSNCLSLHWCHKKQFTSLRFKTILNILSKNTLFQALASSLKQEVPSTQTLVCHQKLWS